MVQGLMDRKKEFSFLFSDYLAQPLFCFEYSRVQRVKIKFPCSIAHVAMEWEDTERNGLFSLY